MTGMNGRSESLPEYTDIENDTLNKAGDAIAFTNDAYNKLMDRFDGSDVIGEELGKRFAQINEKLNEQHTIEKETLQSNTSELLGDVMNQAEVTPKELQLANLLTLQRFKTQFDTEFKIAA